jgi:hypothetical protein
MTSILWIRTCSFIASALAAAGVSCGLPTTRLAGTSIKCSLVQVADNERSGGPAFSFLVPSGWKSETSFHWNGNTYVARLTAMTPNKAYLVDRLEPINMSYNAASGTTATGTRLTKATDFLRLVVQSMPSQPGVGNIRVVEEQNIDLPLSENQKRMQSLRQIGGMSQRLFREQGFLRVSFDRDGTQETAGIETTVEAYCSGNNMALGGSGGQFSSENDSYVVGPTLSIATPISTDPEKVKEAQIVANTAQMSPQFGLFCAKLAAQMAHTAFDITSAEGKRLIQQIRDHTDQIVEDFKSRWEDRDKTVHDFCNYVTDQQDFKSADGTINTLPAYYSYAWKNDQGQFVLTDNPTFDPRGTDNTTWESLQKTIHEQ